MKQFVAICVAIFSINLPLAAEPLQEGAAAYGRGDYAAALKLLLPLAGQGDAYAQANVALMYAKGQGVPQDLARAADWYRKAAEQGNVFAQDNLGLLYATG